MARGTPEAKQAPAPLHLVQAFVNSKNLMRGYDLLATPATAIEWLAELGYEMRGRESDYEELKQLQEIREGFRMILLSHTRSSLPLEPDVEMVTSPNLNRLLGSNSLTVSFNFTGEPVLASSSIGYGKFKEDILAATIYAQHTGLWPRLKACANAGCRWIFYDSSKNRSGNWCIMEICGSRAKMRSYRKKRS
jgi:hypothetical protein